jgi:hypothetical protein
MEKATLRLIIFSALLFVASLVQFLDVTLFGIAPNAVLVVLVVAALYLRDIWHELFLVACASFLLKFSPVADHEILAFFVVGLLMTAIVRKLPWHIFVNGIFLITGATLAMYALIDPSSIPSLMFVKELSYNIILMYVLYHGIALMRPFQSVR